MAITSTNRFSGSARRRATHLDQRGFTLIEAVVSLMLAVAILAGVLTLFDRNNQLARAQTHVAEMQNSLRVGQSELARYIRMAGRGGLPRGPLPGGLAIAVRNNVPEDGDDRNIAIGDTDSPRVLPGTDVLTVRGAISDSVFQVNPLGGGFHLDDLDDPTTGTVRVENPHSTTGVTQSLDPLIDAINNDPHAAILLVSPVDTWAVVEVDKATSITDEEGSVVIGFKVGTLGRPRDPRPLPGPLGWVPDHAAQRRQRRAARGVPLLRARGARRRRRRLQRLHSALGQGALLSQHRGCRTCRTPSSAPRSPTTSSTCSSRSASTPTATAASKRESRPAVRASSFRRARSTRARTSGCSTWPRDVDGDGVGDRGGEVESGGRACRRSPTSASPPSRAPIAVTVGYLAPLLTKSEDKDFGESPNDVFNTIGERRFRRRQLQTVVDMRNLS